MKITGDDEIGKAQLDNFINPKKVYPVIATTSELMSTGVDAKTCKLIVLDQNIQSMTKFKQIIGRGTHIDSMLFERTALSNKPDELIKLVLNQLAEQKLTPDLLLKDPYLLYF